MHLLLQIVNPVLTASVAAVADSLSNPVAEATAGPQQDSFNLLSMLGKGGPMMIPMGVLFALSIFICIERFLAISRAGKSGNNLLTQIKVLLGQGNFEAAKSLCASHNSPESIMLGKGVSRIGQPMSEIREVMNESGSHELSKLEKNLSILNITGRIAPMFGFVGTIIGVIKIFYDISLAGNVEISVVSAGLYEKMISSASGLVVGVAAFVAYHWMGARIDKIARMLEDRKIDFMELLNQPVK